MLENFNRIPAELRERPQWIVWRFEDTTSAKPTKVPYQAKNRSHASVTDPSTWSTFDEVCAAYTAAEGLLAGIGFIFSKNDEFAGIDLDKAKDAQAVKIQTDIFNKFDSYSERSPSGQGLHIIIKANLLSGRRRSGVEMYSSERFFTMTGDIFHDAPIKDCQQLAEILWQEMGQIKHNSDFKGSFEEKETDDEIVKQALAAVNGDKFKTLLEGRWIDLYASQSEADFAFIDIIAFYTQSRNQIVRIFRNSVLGQRDKANRPDYIQYMLNRAFDRILPPIDIEGLANKLEEFKARNNPALAIVPAADTPEPSPYTLPAGLLGEIAAFIYAASPRPVPEIALAAAIGFLAGVVGRAYNVSSMGLSQYVLLLAPTGTGKEAMASGIDKLVIGIRDQIPAIKEFLGPSEIASGQALLKYMSKTSCCFVSIIGEFGLKMQQITHRNANSSELMLKKILLDLYNKTGVDRFVRPSIYSQRENNTEVILAPSFTLLGESTPHTFFDNVDESIIKDGLLPRFTLIEYKGKRPKLNEAHSKAEMSPELKNKLATLLDTCLRLAHGVEQKPMVINVKFTDEAYLAVSEFNDFSDNKINNSDSEVITQLWNRAHVKLMKLAALVAVGINPFEPIITMEIVIWARNIVKHDINMLYQRFETGDFGKASEETRQFSDLKRTIKDFIERPLEDLKAYQINAKLYSHRVIPYAFLSRKLVSMASYRHDRMGATLALKRALGSFIESGNIVEIGKKEMLDKFETSQRAFMVLNFDWLAHI